MFSLRSALQKYARRASILGNLPIRHHTPGSSIHISHQLALSNRRKIFQKYSKLRRLEEEEESRRRIVNNPKAGETPSITKNKALNTTQAPKNLEFRRYHICVSGFSEKHTHAALSDALQEFYSRFGEIVRCTVGYNHRNKIPEGVVVFSSKQAVQRALESSPHRFRGEKVKAQIGAEYKELNLRVQNLSPETTEESLRDFYSKFGRLTQCLLNKYPDRGQSPIGYITFASQAEMNRALDAQPHFIDGSEVFLRYATNELDLVIRELPKGITEESLRTYFSQYGQLRHCEVIAGTYTHTGITHAFLSFSSVDEVNRAMENLPHVIDNTVLRTDFVDKCILYPIIVGSLPENISRATLYSIFDKFGKVIRIEVREDGEMDQIGSFILIVYGTKEEADKALNAGPNEINGVTYYVKRAKEKIEYGRKENDRNH